MQVSYSADPVDLDQPLAQAQAERPDKPIRVRLQPSLLRAGGDHVAWRGVAWTIDCADVTEAIALRATLEIVFDTIAGLGPEAVAHALTGLTTGE